MGGLRGCGGSAKAASDPCGHVPYGLARRRAGTFRKRRAAARGDDQPGILAVRHGLHASPVAGGDARESQPVQKTSIGRSSRSAGTTARPFLAKINQRLPGLDLTLPTEAQWEYACRAGTDAATYAGPLEILGENNAPVLDAIAWYGGNSGVDFDLNDGEDASQWSNKQYDHQRAGTHPVRLKQPNPWGLYDVLGNVWEWCSDGPRQYTDEPAVDPVGPIGGAERSLRGGCWISDARRVRCAYRRAYHRAYHPGHRNDGFGFRPARVQQSAAPVAEPAGPALGRMGAARPTQDQPGEAARTKSKSWWPWSRNR